MSHNTLSETAPADLANSGAGGRRGQRADPLELHPARRARRRRGLRALGGHAVRLPGARRNGRWGCRNPQLRAHAGVPGVRLLQRQGQAGRAQRAGQELREAVRRTGAGSRRRADRRSIKQLGGKPIAKPTFVFPVSSQSSFLALASVLENTGVGAYNGAAPSLKSKQVLAAAGSIVQIEARHAAAINLLIEQEPHAERRLRRAADQSAGARQGGATDQERSGRRVGACGPDVIRRRPHRVVTHKRSPPAGPRKSNPGGNDNHGTRQSNPHRISSDPAAAGVRREAPARDGALAR